MIPGVGVAVLTHNPLFAGVTVGVGVSFLRILHNLLWEQTPEPESLESLGFGSHNGAGVANLGNHCSPSSDHNLRQTFIAHL